MSSIRRVILCVIVSIFIVGGEMGNADESKLLTANDVLIAGNAVGMPIGRLLLIRKDNTFCAMRFTQNWTGKTKYEQHAEYESYYQGDKTGNFQNSITKYLREEVYYTKPSFSIMGHPIRIGAKRDISCGPIELWWSAGPHSTFVYYNRHDQNQGDFYGIELAPTPWTEIREVNVFDPRITWYRYDDKRTDEIIPIDQLWDDRARVKMILLRQLIMTILRVSTSRFSSLSGSRLQASVQTGRENDDLP